MSINDQRIALAEIQGWKWYRRLSGSKIMRSLYHPALVFGSDFKLEPADMSERQCNSDFIFYDGHIPTLDLSFIYDIEETFNRVQWLNYKNILHDVLFKKEKFSEEALIHASLEEKSEAILRMHSKWKD